MLYSTGSRKRLSICSQQKLKLMELSIGAKQRTTWWNFWVIWCKLISNSNSNFMKFPCDWIWNCIPYSITIIDNNQLHNMKKSPALKGCPQWREICTRVYVWLIPIMFFQYQWPVPINREGSIPKSEWNSILKFFNIPILIYLYSISNLGFLLVQI